MIRIPLFIILMHLALAFAFGQSVPAKDTTYTPRELKLDEVNLVSSYYKQNGNNSAVTGGIGTESLTDFSNSMEIKLSRNDIRGRMHHIALDCGIDAYTSASSDKIDPNTISSASYRDTRVYPSISWSMNNAVTGNTVGANVAYSTEYDYESYGMGIVLGKTSKDGNRDFGVRLNTFFDTWKIVRPVELRGRGLPGSAPRNSYNAAFVLSQVINKRLQMAFLAEPGYQEGLLGTTFQRVYFKDHSVHHEFLPDTRWKLALGVKANYFIGGGFILRSYYRYYMDEWNLQSHTLSLEAPVKVAPWFTFMPFYRYYTQQGISYFAPYEGHQSSDTYYTSDYDLSTLQSHSYGAGLRLTPSTGILGIPMWNNIELRYEHYNRSTGLVADILSLGLRFIPDFTLLKSKPQASR